MIIALKFSLISELVKITKWHKTCRNNGLPFLPSVLRSIWLFGSKKVALFPHHHWYVYALVPNLLSQNLPSGFLLHSPHPTCIFSHKLESHIMFSQLFPHKCLCLSSFKGRSYHPWYFLAYREAKKRSDHSKYKKMQILPHIFCYIIMLIFLRAMLC